MSGPDLRHPVSLRGIDWWLDQIAGSLRAHAEQPAEIRDIAYSLESRARAIRRDPEYAQPPAYQSALADSTDEKLREALMHLGPEKRARLRELLLAPIEAPSSGDVTATLEGVQGSPPRWRVHYITGYAEAHREHLGDAWCYEGDAISTTDSEWVRIVSVDQEPA